MTSSGVIGRRFLIIIQTKNIVIGVKIEKPSSILFLSASSLGMREGDVSVFLLLIFSFQYTIY